ncbi:MAG: hypothetical protein ACR2PG_16140 [Hyphomicrobiaceae bacterium]
MLPEGIDLMRTWAFSYKTVAFNWVKINKAGRQKTIEDNPFFVGLGFWTRANPELCLVGTCCRPPRLAKDVRLLLFSEHRQHRRQTGRSLWPY